MRDIVNGLPPLSPGVARRILAYFTTDRTLVLETDDPGTRLSARESEVLQMIAKGYSWPKWRSS